MTAPIPALQMKSVCTRIRRKDQDIAPEWSDGRQPPWSASLEGATGRRHRSCDNTCRTLGVMIKDEVKTLVEGRNFATISTLLPGGHIQAHVVWVDCDEDHIVINTEVELRKFKNVQADPRVTVTIWDRKNPYFFAEVRGRVVQIVTGPEARANINALAQKYLDADYPDELIQSERVILKIAPDSQIVFARGMHDIRR